MSCVARVGGEKHDGHRGEQGVRANDLQHVEPAHPRQIPVEHDQIGGVGAGQLERVFGGGGGHDVEADGLEHRAYHVAQVGVVVDQEHPRALAAQPHRLAHGHAARLRFPSRPVLDEGRGRDLHDWVCLSAACEIARVGDARSGGAGGDAGACAGRSVELVEPLPVAPLEDERVALVRQDSRPAAAVAREVPANSKIARTHSPSRTRWPSGRGRARPRDASITARSRGRSS